MRIHPLSHSSLLKFAIKYVSRGRLQVRIILAQEASPRYPTTVHPSGYCGNLKKRQHWVCLSLLFVFMILELRCSLSGSVSMEQEDVNAAKEFETPCVFFSYLHDDYLTNAFMKDSKSKRRFTQLLWRTIIRTHWLSTRHFERNWIFTKIALNFPMLSKWARHPLLKLSPTRLRPRGWSFFFKSQRMNASIRMRRSSQQILLRRKGGLRSRLRPCPIFPPRSSFYFSFK